MITRELKRLRTSAAPTDLNSSALREPPPAEFRPSMASRYIKPEYKARTLGELEKWAGEHGAAAIADAEWRAVSLWHMNAPAIAPGSCRALTLYQGEVRRRLGVPRFDSRDWPAHFAALVPSDRIEVEAVAMRLRSTWRQQGSPGLLAAIQTTQQRVHSALIAQAEAAAHHLSGEHPHAGAHN